MELNRLLLLTSFLLHIKEGHARPMGPVCDKRLIQKYIGEAKDMEKRMVRKQRLPKPSIRLGWQNRAGKNSRRLTTAILLPQQSECQALPTLSCPVVLPLVDFNMRQWKSKSVRGAGRMVLGCLWELRRSPWVSRGMRSPNKLNKRLVETVGGTGALCGDEVEDPSTSRVGMGTMGLQPCASGVSTHTAPQDEIKWREILCNLVLLVGAVTEAQGQVSQECGANQLRQLYRHANSFLLLLQTFGWEEGLCCSPSSIEQTQVTEIFLTYRQLVQGKLRFFFHNLAKDSCD
ncbi:thrombopoietin isoform X5 [Lagopus leucura]|uniref:thrombopoietin isoform X5 n=1 Tax=Lagopus leucura TaxID=30410 RepID=UPI001C68276E|nr:thrombopoietin isoform X5 [Lagopus leucura]